MCLHCLGQEGFELTVDIIQENLLFVNEKCGILIGNIKHSF